MNIQLPRIIPSQELLDEYQELCARLQKEHASLDQSQGFGAGGNQGEAKYVAKCNLENTKTVVASLQIIRQMNLETNPSRYLDFSFQAFSLLANDYDKKNSSFQGKTAIFGKKAQELKQNLSRKKKFDELARSLFQRLQTWVRSNEMVKNRQQITFEPARSIPSLQTSPKRLRKGFLSCLERSDSDERSETPGISGGERSYTPGSSSTDRSETPGALSEGV